MKSSEMSQINLVLLLKRYFPNVPNFWRIKTAYFYVFLARDSAEASAEASVDLTEASVSAESLFTPIRSFTSERIFL